MHLLASHLLLALIIAPWPAVAVWGAVKWMRGTL